MLGYSLVLASPQCYGLVGMDFFSLAIRLCSFHEATLLTHSGRTDGRKLMAIPLPRRCVWPGYDLDLWPLNLKTFPAISVTWWISLAIFIEIPPLSTEISRQVRQLLTDIGRTAGRTTSKRNAPRLLLLAEAKMHKWRSDCAQVSLYFQENERYPSRILSVVVI